MQHLFVLGDRFSSLHTIVGDSDATESAFDSTILRNTAEAPPNEWHETQHLVSHVSALDPVLKHAFKVQLLQGKPALSPLKLSSDLVVCSRTLPTRGAEPQYIPDSTTTVLKIWTLACTDKSSVAVNNDMCSHSHHQTGH